MIYTVNPDKPRFERIQLALEDLKHTGNVNIYLYRRNRLRLIQTKPL